MNKTRKILVTMVFLILFIILGNTKSNAGSLYLNNLDFDAKINEDGSMNVTETWDISIDSTNTLFKTFKTDSSKYTSISDVKVSEVTGGSIKDFKEINSIMYHVTNNCYYGLKNDEGNFEIAWGVGLDNSSATKKYKISYKVNDVIAKYQDCAELYWQFIGSDFEISCDNITGTILLPKNAESKDDIRVWGHTEGLNGEIYAVDLNKIEFNLYDFMAGRYVEIRSAFPSNIINSTKRTYSTSKFDEIIEEETNWANLANQRREKAKQKRKVISMIFIVVCGFLDIILIKKSIKLIKKASKTKKIKPSMEMKYFREMPRRNATPAQSIYVYNELLATLSTKQMGDVFSATLLDLCLKKYINFEENPEDKKNIIIKILKKEADDKLESSEKIILQYIVGAACGKDNLTIKDIEKYMKKHASNLVELKEDIEHASIREITNNKLYDKNEAEEKKKYNNTSIFNGSMIMVIFFVGIGVLPVFLEYITGKALFIGIVSLIVAFILKSISTSMYNKKINVYTEKGIDEKQMWKGLKKYMEDFSMLDKREIPELVIWEQFLVYATAFGIADKVIKQLKSVYKELGRSFEFDDTSYGYMYFVTNNNFSSNFTNAISSTFTSAYASNYSGTYSSGSGFGGGFSGGGGGGGRWRSVEAGR